MLAAHYQGPFCPRLLVLLLFAGRHFPVQPLVTEPENTKEVVHQEASMWSSRQW
jgi:hypothetical protein